MKSFKDFLNIIKAYVPDEPIHFKHAGKKDEKHYVPDSPIHFKHVGEKPKGDHYVPDEPVHFKMGNPPPKKLDEKEQLELGQHWGMQHDNGHIFQAKKHNSAWVEHNRNVEGVAKTLVKSAPKYTPAQKRSIDDYGDESTSMNLHLVQNHNKGINSPSPEHKKLIQHLDSVTKRPIGHDLHVYSGIGFNPAEHMQHTDKLHLPAYTSVTHDKHVAAGYADNHTERLGNNMHVLHIHMQHHDMGAHVSHLTPYAAEYETILPRHTTLKVHPQPDVFHDKNSGKTAHVWHATIHHQGEE